jgi:hypothetical protein
MEFEWVDKIEEAHILPNDSYFIVLTKTPDHLYHKFLDLYGFEFVSQSHVFDSSAIRYRVGERYLLVVYPPGHTKDIYDDIEPFPIEWDSYVKGYGKRESLYDKYLMGGFTEVTEEQFLKGVLNERV